MTLRRILYVFLCLFLFFSWGYSSVPKLEENHELIEHVMTHLPHKGLLEQTEKGFIYLDICDDYILQLYPLLLKKHGNVEIPPYFKEGGVGGHISVVPSSESIKEGIDLSEEDIGREIHFTVNGLYSVKPDEWACVERVWYLSIECAKLEDFRRSKGLSPKINDHDFHITIAIEYVKSISE